MLGRLIEKIQNKNTPIKLYWWRYEEAPNGNFGDEITHYLVEKILKKKTVWSPPPECTIVGAGSVIPIVARERQENSPYIWGSGFIEDGSEKISFNDYKLLAVRGHKSLSRITDMPETSSITLGDPGLLANELVRTPIKKTHKLGIIAHYANTKDPFIQQLSDRDDVLVIDPLDKCLNVLRNIASCESVISSSLHGLIVADSFAIPNSHVILEGHLKGGLYKFNDYYSVFGKERYSSVNREDLQLSTDTLVDIVRSQYVPAAEEVTDIQRRLKAALVSVASNLIH